MVYLVLFTLYCFSILICADLVGKSFGRFSCVDLRSAFLGLILKLNNRKRTNNSRVSYFLVAVIKTWLTALVYSLLLLNGDVELNAALKKNAAFKNYRNSSTNIRSEMSLEICSSLPECFN